MQPINRSMTAHGLALAFWCSHGMYKQTVQPLTSTSYGTFSLKHLRIPGLTENLPFVARLHLMVSTTDGIWQVSVPKSSPKRKLLDLHASKPTHVQCDSIHHRIYWAEEGEGTTDIFQADLKHVGKGLRRLVLRWKQLHIRYRTEG